MGSDGDDEAIGGRKRRIRSRFVKRMSNEVGVGSGGKDEAIGVTLVIC